MSNNKGKTALVTGANSGIGFETAALLAEDGFGKVILACRTLAKGETAKAELLKRVNRDVFEIIAVDVSEPQSAHQASETLKQRNSKIDLLILNAGMSTGTNHTYNSDGIELTFASTLVGHHVLTMRLLENQLLSDKARIVIAGSEAARGEMPGASIIDFQEFANQHFHGDLEAGIEATMRVQEPFNKSSMMGIYATAKVYVAWWSTVLAQKVPNGIIVNTISPGSVPATSFSRHWPFLIRKLMAPAMKLMGMASSLEDGARRYIDGGNFDDNTTGHFFASPPKKIVGDIEIQTEPHFFDQASQNAFWNVLVRVTGNVDYPVSA